MAGRNTVVPSTNQSIPQISVPDSAPAAPTPVSSGASGKELTAPLPGVIVAVMVKPGDSVSHGQELCTLEAMKMKNAIKSHRDGTIDSVAVTVGDQVGSWANADDFQGLREFVTWILSFLIEEITRGFSEFTLGIAIMILVGVVLIVLAVVKEYEPVLLLPIGFGCIMANIGMSSR